MAHIWEHDWKDLGSYTFWCSKCGILKSETDRAFYHPLGGDWIESPPPCVVSDDGPDDEPCQCPECVAARNAP
jgi:hypothetical protein